MTVDDVGGWWDLASYQESGRAAIRMPGTHGVVLKREVLLPTTDSIQFSCPEMNELYHRPTTCCAACGPAPTCKTDICKDNPHGSHASRAEDKCWSCCLGTCCCPCLLIGTILQAPCYLWNWIRGNPEEDKNSVLRTHTNNCGICRVKSAEWKCWWDNTEWPRVQRVLETVGAKEAKQAAENTRLLEAHRNAMAKDDYARRLAASKSYKKENCEIDCNGIHRMRGGQTLYLYWYDCPNCKVRMTDSYGNFI